MPSVCFSKSAKAVDLGPLIDLYIDFELVIQVIHMDSTSHIRRLSLLVLSYQFESQRDSKKDQIRLVVPITGPVSKRLLFDTVFIFS